MAYDEKLAERVRRTIGPRGDVSEKKMFGGLAFLLDGKMFCGIASGDLMVRVGPEGHGEALAEPHVRPMDFTGRPMKGYVFVGPGGTRTEQAIKRWVDRSASFVATLDGAAKRSARRSPPKAGAKASSRGRPAKKR